MTIVAHVKRSYTTKSDCQKPSTKCKEFDSYEKFTAVQTLVLIVYQHQHTQYMPNLGLGSPFGQYFKCISNVYPISL